jgi:hypothetical protein
MSVELQYQGLPKGCGLVELAQDLARQDAKNTFLEFVPSWLKHGASVAGKVVLPSPQTAHALQGEGSEVWKWCCKVRELFPGIENYNAYVGKRPNTLRFMLSPEYRYAHRWPRPHPLDPRAWNDPVAPFEAAIGRAFFDAPEIAPGVTATQGAPIRVIEPSVVLEISLHTESIDNAMAADLVEELVVRTDVAAWDREAQLGIFAEFRNFFRTAADNGDSVMVIYD